MIDKITITVNHDGAWLLNGGNVIHVQTSDRGDLLKQVNDLLSKLGYFPPADPLAPDPVPFEKLRIPKDRAKAREEEKQKRARIKAEKHLDTLRSQ